MIFELVALAARGGGEEYVGSVGAPNRVNGCDWRHHIRKRLVLGIFDYNYHPGICWIVYETGQISYGLRGIDC